MVAQVVRRVAVSRVLAALAAVNMAPQWAPALPTPPPEALKLAAARAKAASLVVDLPSLGADDLQIYVPQLASLSFKPAPAQLRAIAPKLDVRASDLAADLEEHVAKLSAAGRAQSADAAKAEAAAVLKDLDEALALAAAAFAMPAAKGSDSFDMTSYFGVFTCEGVGLERKPDSNECIQPAK